MSDSAGRPIPTTRTDPSTFDAGFREHPGYADALAHLYGRLDTEALDPSQFRRVERNLDEYRAFLRRLGDPQLARPTVHITGTRGKGSTLAMLDSILVAAGYTTGSTVSPHLIEVRERVRRNARDLSRAEFARLYATVRPVADELMRGANYRTVFELITALAFVSFTEYSVDTALVEVGMGGNLDATNVVEPVLSIVTRIGLDHTHILGDTVEKIAWDKGRIIKPGGPAVISRQPTGALAVLAERCREVGVHPWRLDHEFRIDRWENRIDGARLAVTTPHRAHPELATPLPGAHQAENAAVAVAAADRLDADGVFTIPAGAVREGLANTIWPGRAEIVEREPVVLLDGAHTDQGATALSALLDDLFPGRRRIYVLGMNRDKDIDGFLDCFRGEPALVLATKAESPRSLPAEEMAEIVRARGWRAESVPLADALAAAREHAAPEDVIVATGSFYVVGALRRVWLRDSGANPTLNE
ncbi:MAG: Folylpolyglutamate synthase [Calditrichaeota bacterium]|nr:Folylpolyglutamate synthase [Calditrichota bacterium]